MADSTIVDIGPREKPEGAEYRLVFSISCTLFYYYDLVTSLSPDIKKVYDQAKGGEVKQPINIPVKEGQTIGRIGGQTLDFAVWDTEKPLSGFIVPEHYDGEAWKIYTADPLDFYTEPLKKLVLAKYPRMIEPLSGKIDYDLSGRAVGNWFREGSGGYASKTGADKAYYKNHLAIAYDNFDPASLVFSIGDFSGEAKQFGIRGNKPDPKDVSASSGLVKYELVQQDWIVPATGKYWDRFSFAKGLRAKNRQDIILGVALVQMIEDGKLKVEVFPGKSANQVSGFTSKAKVYER
jgi:hypothetical protein